MVDDTTVKFEIWDTAGQERYHSLAPMYYRGAQAAIVVYDVTNADTFQRAKAWVRELNEKASSVRVMALAGNKVDLASQRTVDTQVSIHLLIGAHIFLRTYLVLLSFTLAGFECSYEVLPACIMHEYCACRKRRPMRTRTASSSWKRQRGLL